MTREEIEAKISKNRELIGRALNVDMPIDLLYSMIHTLAEHNEELIEDLAILNKQSNGL